jgi:fructose-1,6-bisphosphatase/inositol monophosphatase family enzyme
MKIRPVGAELFYADRGTDAFPNFAKALKKQLQRAQQTVVIQLGFWARDEQLLILKTQHVMK